MEYAISFVVVLLAIGAVTTSDLKWADLKWAPPMVGAVVVLGLFAVIAIGLLVKLLSWLF